MYHQHHRTTRTNKHIFHHGVVAQSKWNRCCVGSASICEKTELRFNTASPLPAGIWLPADRESVLYWLHHMHLYCISHPCSYATSMDTSMAEWLRRCVQTARRANFCLLLFSWIWLPGCFLSPHLFAPNSQCDSCMHQPCVWQLSWFPPLIFFFSFSLLWSISAPSDQKTAALATIFVYWNNKAFVSWYSPTSYAVRPYLKFTTCSAPFSLNTLSVWTHFQCAGQLPTNAGKKV